MYLHSNLIEIRFIVIMTSNAYIFTFSRTFDVFRGEIQNSNLDFEKNSGSHELMDEKALVKKKLYILF